jgi:hypothetical protein
MSSFSKFSSIYQDSVDDVLDQLNDFYTEQLNTIFVGLDVELRHPAGDGFNYERHISGKIRGVQLWLSRPNFDVPLLMCRFEVKGKDQLGADFSDFVKEDGLITKIPWQKFEPPGKFMVISERVLNNGVS